MLDATWTSARSRSSTSAWDVQALVRAASCTGRAVRTASCPSRVLHKRDWSSSAAARKRLATVACARNADSMIGQDAVNVAKAFEDGVGITGVVLTKLDGDARGGAALSVAQVTGKPILFASTGEDLDSFEPFYPDRMASRILDMGDILTLIEKSQQAFDAEQAAEIAEKMAKDSFTLEDFLDQMNQIKKMGSIKSMLGMIPGAGKLKNQLDNFDDSEITKTEAIILSMTPKERREPKILNGSRRLRIAKGSGMTVTDVNSLVNRFEQAAKMMKTVAKAWNQPFQRRRASPSRFCSYRT